MSSSIGGSPVVDDGRFAAGDRAGPGVDVGLGRTGVGCAPGTGVAAVFEFAAVGFGVGDCLGVGLGVTGHRTNPVGVIVHPAGMSCMNGLCPGGMLTVCPPGPIYVCGGAPAGGAPVAHGL